MIFPFSIGNSLFGKICSKISKLLVYAEIWYPQSFTGYARLALIVISVFQGFSASIGGIFVLAGGVGARLSFYGV